MSKIEIRISKTGETHLEVSGTTGSKCEDLTRAFEDALGVKVASQQKPEYFVELDSLHQEAEVHEN